MTQDRHIIVEQRCRDMSKLAQAQYRTAVNIDVVESIVMSCYQRPKQQSWLSRLVGRRPALVDVIQVQLRSKTREFERLQAYCDDDVLLSLLPWLDLHTPSHVPLSQLTTTIAAAVDAGAHFVLGPLNTKPDIHVDTSLHTVLSLAQQNPSKIAWFRICRLLDRVDTKRLVPHMEGLQATLTSWPAEVRIAPKRWTRGRDIEQPYPMGLFFSSVTWLSFNRIMSQYQISPSHLWLLQRMTQLERLNMAEVELQSVEQVQGLHNLEHLTMRNMAQISNLGGLSSLVKLETLWLDKCYQIEDFSWLTSLKKLRSLRLHEVSKVTSIGFLNHLPQLTSLALKDADVEDWSPITALDKLNDLELVNTSMRNLNPLTSLKHLQYLMIWKSTIDDLSPLTSLPQLQEFDLCWSDVATDAEPIAALRAAGVKVDIRGTTFAHNDSSKQEDIA